jgi:uncharacterized repeat protein (TIGR03809 family)
MLDHQPFPSLDGVAQKWRALAERRRAHFVDMFASGRWKHYYTEQQFLQIVREAIQQCERWAMIAPPPVENESAADQAAASSPAALAAGGSAAALDETAAADEEPAPVILQRPAA